MGFDEAFKSVLIANEAKLNLYSNHLVVRQEEFEAKIYLKDINFIILESMQINLTSNLLSALAKNKIILLTCDETHCINGVFSPYLGHFQSAKIAKMQIAVREQTKAILWQKIIKNKINNQAYVLENANKIREAKQLRKLAKEVLLNDKSNIEATAAALYFKTLFGIGFSRDSLCLENSALNYGYAIVRACIIRAVCISGLLPWSGIKHDNVYNAFSLCDDLIEPFRPIVDLSVLRRMEFEKTKEICVILNKDFKRNLINNLQREVRINGKDYPLNRAINQYVQNFKNALFNKEELRVVEFND
ncbi:type II CRISPR-associated endonuclease Cas1 [Helicobacter burdigaliensis]|uniref:type II CRISPR-associated endonuclease Cas1 n=1 Tax=Helicobacter burdigaliensis TaxID=2315334 RepID=UPI000EF70BA2|nr:type II CRISPR-associated endonuclease Cas1 [Helicobacter burdigaliensis]